MSEHQMKLRIGVKSVIEHFSNMVGSEINYTEEQQKAFHDLVTGFADVIVSETIQAFVKQVSVAEFASMRDANVVETVSEHSMMQEKEDGHVH